MFGSINCKCGVSTTVSVELVLSRWEGADGTEFKRSISYLLQEALH